MGIRSFMSAVFPKRPRQDADRTPTPETTDKAAQAAARLRGDKVTAMPADHRPNSIENVSAAARDYGLSLFSGESDAMGSAAAGYRATKKRRRRGRA